MKSFQYLFGLIEACINISITNIDNNKSMEKRSKKFDKPFFPSYIQLNQTLLSFQFVYIICRCFLKKKNGIPKNTLECDRRIIWFIVN